MCELLRDNLYEFSRYNRCAAMLFAFARGTALRATRQLLLLLLLCCDSSWSRVLLAAPAERLLPLAPRPIRNAIAQCAMRRRLSVATGRAAVSLISRCHGCGGSRSNVSRRSSSRTASSSSTATSNPRTSARWFSIPRSRNSHGTHAPLNVRLAHPVQILIKSYSRCEVKVIDFGSSCFETDHLSSYVQSRSYRAPEVILGLAYGEKIDLWSLGAILGELLTGYVLFQASPHVYLSTKLHAVLPPGSFQQRHRSRRRSR